MVKKSIEISCPGGLEPRPIAELVQVASKYESKVYLETESIMGMMSMNIANGDLLVVSAEGSDEEGAMDEILGFLKQKLGVPV